MMCVAVNLLEMERERCPTWFATEVWYVTPWKRCQSYYLRKVFDPLGKRYCQPQSDYNFNFPARGVGQEPLTVRGSISELVPGLVAGDAKSKSSFDADHFDLHVIALERCLGCQVS